MSTDGPAIYVQMDSLSTWPRNYRRGHIEKIANSIKRFGFNQTLRIRDGIIYAGNHTFKGLQLVRSNGWDLPAGIIEDPAGGWLVPCLDISHLSQEESEAFATIDNRLSDIAENDDEQLAIVLADIAQFDTDLLNETGYDIDDLNEMVGYKEPTFEPDQSDEQGRMDKPRIVTCPHCGGEVTV